MLSFGDLQGGAIILILYLFITLKPVICKEKMNKQTSKVLFVHSGFTPFVKTDYEILQSKFKVVDYQFKQFKTTYDGLKALGKQLSFMLFNVWKYDLVFCWFAGYHTMIPLFFARLFSKKSIIVVGGYDVARIRAYHYGSFSNKARGFFTKYSLSNSTLNVCVSHYVERRLKAITRNVNSKVIYNCFDLEEKKGTFPEAEKPTILTVGLVNDAQKFLIKGFDTFIAVARKLPQYEFVIVGLDKEKLKEKIGQPIPNLKIVKKIPHKELTQYYEKSSIYCQVSRVESFGVALVESMVFECYPMVTDAGALKEVIGNTGTVVKRNAEKIAVEIKEVIETDAGTSVKAKHRAKNLFNKYKRHIELIKAVDGVLNNQTPSLKIIKQNG